jgi:hypothetical protein
VRLLRPALWLLALACAASPAGAEEPSPGGGTAAHALAFLGLSAYQGDLTRIALVAPADWAPPDAPLRLEAGRPERAALGSSGLFGPALTVGFAGDLSPVFSLGLEVGVMDPARSAPQLDTPLIWPVAQLTFVYRF